MRRLLFAPAFLALSLPAGAAELDGGGIRSLLTGNSIIHPDFGCVHYPDASTSVSYSGGQEFTGAWSVKGNLYFSSGQCGEIGCILEGNAPEYVFRRVDGQYSQPVVIMKGNYCRKDGVIS